MDLLSRAEICGYFTQRSQTKLINTRDTFDKMLNILNEKRKKKKKRKSNSALMKMSVRVLETLDFFSLQF